MQYDMKAKALVSMFAYTIVHITLIHYVDILR